MFRNFYNKYFLAPVRNIIKDELRASGYESDKLKIQNGKILCNQLLANPAITALCDAEFQVFSQWGDDGIIQYLIHKINISNKTFIEFGVENYMEANTRFLLINNNWKGLIIDSNEQHINAIKQDTIYWRHDLIAVCSFITAENINSLFIDNGFTGNTGILSIDIDGNDYWVWEKINSVNADIVIAEYNSVFGEKHAITIPYNPSFTRQQAHYSYLYWGCSLKALCNLAQRKGYIFVGCNSNGNNAYFVKKEKANGLKSLTCEEGFVESKFRESRNENGKLNFVGGKERIKQISEMPVVDIEKNQIFLLKELL